MPRRNSYTSRYQKSQRQLSSLIRFQEMCEGACYDEACEWADQAVADKREELDRIAREDAIDRRLAR